MGKITRIWGLIAWLVCFAASPAYATDWGSKDVTMEVGETTTLYLPSSITTKSLKSVAFYSASYNYVEVVSYTNYSVKVKALKPTSTPVIVRCDYYYYINNGGYIYQNGGAYDFKIKVTGDTTTKPTQIVIPDMISIEVGESMDIEAEVLPLNAEYKLTWTISDTSIATIGFIGETAMITGKSVGYTDLKVKADNGVYKMCRISVYKPKPTSVRVKSSLDMEVGTNSQLYADVSPLNSQYTLTWSSNNTNVATVSQTGLVTAKGAGSAVISVQTDNGKSAVCNVTVVAPKTVFKMTDLEGNLEIPDKACVEYERQFYEGWNSICVPFAFCESDLKAFAEGMKIAVFERLIDEDGSPTQFALKIVSSVEAGTPCLIYSPIEVKGKFSYEDVSLASTPNNDGPLKGSFTTTLIGKGKYKLAGGEKIGITTEEDATCYAYRAYLDMQ